MNRRTLLSTSFFCFFASLCALVACPDQPILPIIEARDIDALKTTAADLADCPQWQDSLGLVYHTLGVCYYLEDDYAAAIEWTHKAKTLRNQLEAGGSPHDLAKSLRNLGRFHEAIGQSFDAIASYEEARQVYKKWADRPGERYVRLKLGGLYRYLGDYEKSVNLLTFLIRDATAAEDFEQAEARLDLSYTLIELDRFPEAIQHLEKAIPVFEDYEDTDYVARALQNKCLAYYEAGQYTIAIRDGQQSLALHEALENWKEACSVGNLLALSCLKTNRWTEADGYIQESLNRSKANDWPDLVAMNQDNYGELLLLQKKWPEARAQFEAAILSISPSLRTSLTLDHDLMEGLAAVSAKEDLFIYLSDFVRACLQSPAEDLARADWQKTGEYLAIADFLVDQLRFSHSSQTTKLFWREKVLPFYELAISWAYRQQDHTVAFYYFEKSKSILLLEALLAAQAKGLIPDSLRMAEQRLLEQLNQSREALAEASQEEQAGQLRKILETEEELSRFRAALTKAYPQYLAFTQQDLVPERKAFGEQYLPTRALVHFFMGEERTYVLSCQANGDRLIDLGNSDSIRAAVKQFLVFFQSADAITNAPQVYVEQAHQLFERLLAPLELPSATELLIIPSGILAYLPFEALVSSPASSLLAADFLLKKHAILYGYSASLFALLHSTAKPGSRSEGMLAMAPFQSRSQPGLPQLSYSQEELSVVQEHFKATTQIDEAASLPYFLQRQEEFAVLHLSTHAYSSFTDSQPRIYFADSVLYLSDLYRMHIPADLVVLSACQSNIGQLARGEGMLGLGRGFCYAGSRSVVASLWNLNDRSTSQIMDGFYQELAAQQPKGLALRNAKLAYLERDDIPSFQRSPYYWAGLIYYGNQTPLVIRSAFPLAKALVVGLLLAVLLVVGYKSWFGRA